MKEAREYRYEAKSQCDFYVKPLILITLIVVLIELIIGFTIKETMPDGTTVESTPFGFLSFFLSGPIALGWASVSKRVYNRESLKVENIFYGFKTQYWKSCLANLLQIIYLIGWAIISLGVMAIIKSLAYSMTYYVMEDNPSLSANEAITESRRIMDGHKGEYFWLILTYIGWGFLCVLTLGVLSLWVTPRIQQATYLFYLDCKAEAK